MGHVGLPVTIGQIRLRLERTLADIEANFLARILVRHKAGKSFTTADSHSITRVLEKTADSAPSVQGMDQPLAATACWWTPQSKRRTSLSGKAHGNSKTERSLAIGRRTRTSRC
jgi:hypothetical protein